MKNARVSALAWALFFLAAASGGAQSNEILDEILAQEAISRGQAAYLVLTAAERIPETAGIEEAYSALEAASWKLRAGTASDRVRLGEYSYILMKAFELKGGLLYRLSPGPRYASRELAFRGFIQGSRDPSRPVSGEQALFLLARVLEWKESTR